MDYLSPYYLRFFHDAVRLNEKVLFVLWDEITDIAGDLVDSRY